MSKKFKKILSILTVAALLLGTLAVSPVLAEDAITTYKTVDISGVYNSKAYISASDLQKEITIESDNDFWYFGGQLYYNNYALDKEAVEALKDENGLVYDKNGVPFNWNTEGAITIAGTDTSKQSDAQYSNSQTVDVPDGSYSKLHFLAHMIANEASWVPFHVTVTYTDGTTATTAVDLYGQDQNIENAISVGYFAHWVQGKQEKVTFTNDYSKNSAAVNTYTVALDSAKTVASVKFYNNLSNYACWYEHAKVLALTLEGDFLTDKIEAIPAATDVTKGNAYSVKTKIEEIDTILKENNMTLEDLPEAYAEKLTAVSAKANEILAIIEATTEYTTVDLTPFNNSQTYLNSTNYSSVTLNTYDDFMSFGGASYLHNYAFDSDSIEALKTNGLVYDNNGIPFDWNTDGAVSIGLGTQDSPYVGYTFTKTNTVDVEDGKYSKIDFLAFNFNGSAPYYNVFSVELQYTDGSKTSTAVTVNSNSGHTANAIAIGTYVHWTANLFPGDTVTSFAKSGASYVDTYSVDVDQAKALDKVRFYNNGTSTASYAYEKTKVLALTLESDKLNTALSAVPEASAVRTGNLESAKAAINNLDKVLAAQNKTYSDLTEEEQAKITTVKEKIAELDAVIKLSDTYSTVDLSSFNNSQAYVTDSNYIAAVVESNDDFFTWGGDNYRHNLAFNKNYIDSLKVDGLVYDKTGIPFDWNTDGAISISGSNAGVTYTNSVAVDIEDGKYSKANFLAYSVSGSATYHAFTVELQYTDGTKASEQIDINGMTSNDETAINIKNHVHWTTGCTIGSTMKYDAASSASNSVYTYSVNADSGKTLDKIRFYNNSNNYGNWYEQTKVFALTLSDNGINSEIDALPEIGAVTADNAIEIKKTIWEIEEKMEAKNVSEEELTTERRAKLAGLRSVLKSTLSSLYTDVAVNEFALNTSNNSDGSLNADVSAEIINYFDEAKNVSVIMVVYDGNKLSRTIEVKDISAKADGITSIDESFKVSGFDNLEDGKIKVFLWSGLGNLRSLCAGKEYARQIGITGALNSNIKYTGRWEATKEGMKSHWSGAYAETIFTGTTLSVVLGDTATNFFAEIDGTKTLFENVSGTVKLTETPLSEGEHTLKIYGQSINKNIEILGFVIDDGAELKAPVSDKLLIEFIGDSITAGQCQDLVDVTTSYSWKTLSDNENIDRVIVAQPGITLVNDSYYWFDKGMSELYFKLDGSKTAYESVDYDAAKYSPDIIVVNIGTNDQSRIWTGEQTDVTTDKITSTMKTFLENVRAAHQDAEIFVLRAFHGYGAQYISSAVNALSTDTKLHYVDTTDWLDEEQGSTDFYDDLHPTAEAHDKIATKLEAVLGEYITK